MAFCLSWVNMPGSPPEDGRHVKAAIDIDTAGLAVSAWTRAC
jgi:hypothetical protein